MALFNMTDLRARLTRGQRLLGIDPGSKTVGLALSDVTLTAWLTSMIRAVYENPASFQQTPAGRTEARQWLEHGYALAEKDFRPFEEPYRTSRD